MKMEKIKKVGRIVLYLRNGEREEVELRSSLERKIRQKNQMN